MQYTGTPPLAILFGILILSLPWIRHRAYEVFYHVHFWLAVTYVGLLFWHAGQEGDSWVYMWATITAWLLSILARAFWFTRSANVMQKRWMVGSPVRIRALPGNMTAVELPAPEDFHWQPGQHAYLRFPTVAIFDNHPFTIGSAENQNLPKSDNGLQTVPVLSFYIRSQAGFTRRIRDYIATHADPQLDAWVEGPYGGHHRDVGLCFDNVLLVIGGSGISAALPWLEHFAGRLRQNATLRTSSVKLIWSVRDRHALSWISDALNRLDLNTLDHRIEVLVHITAGFPSEQHEGTGTMLSNFKDLAMDVQAAGEDRRHGDWKFDHSVRAGRMNMQTLFCGLKHSSRTTVIGKSMISDPEICGADSSQAVVQKA